MLVVSLWKQTPNAMHVAEVINVKFLSEVKQKVSLCFWYLSILYSIVIVAFLRWMDLLLLHFVVLWFQKMRKERVCVMMFDLSGWWMVERTHTLRDKNPTFGIGVGEIMAPFFGVRCKMLKFG